MVEVFKTNVQEERKAAYLVSLLLEQFPGSRINFDLHDCDNILRVEGEDFEAQKVMELLTEEGFSCSVLD